MTSIASNGPLLYRKYMPTGVFALVWPGMWCGTPTAEPSRRLGLVSIQQSKCTLVGWFCRINMTSIASNGPILYLKYMPTGVVALLWPGMRCGTPTAGPSRRLGLVSIRLSKCTLFGWFCRFNMTSIASNGPILYLKYVNDSKDSLLD